MKSKPNHKSSCGSNVWYFSAARWLWLWYRKKSILQNLEDAADAWQKLSRKIDRYRIDTMLYFYVHERRDDALRKILKYSYVWWCWYAEIRHWVRYSLGLPRRWGFAGSTSHGGYRIRKWKPLNCPKSIKRPWWLWIFWIFAYFDDLSSKNNLIYPGILVQVASVDRFKFTGEYEPNGSLGGNLIIIMIKVIYFSPPRDYGS